jgi:threonine/homoserine efflux transporter RhtA
LKPVIAALLALVVLSNQISGMQVIAIIVVCGCVAGELFYTPMRRLLGGVKV